MKKLFLHIGAGKTGTSALQTHFSLNREVLMAHHCYYPKSQNDMHAQNFKVTSGNAIVLGELLRDRNCSEEQIKRLISHYVQDAEGRDILLSSEVLEPYHAACAQKLKRIVEGYGYELVVIYYVRALADHLVSSYHQLLKRHLYQKSFAFFIEKKTNRFLEIIERSIEVFGKQSLCIKNYDRVKQNIFLDFLENVLHIESTEGFIVSQKTVNRSLFPSEVILMQMINRVFKSQKLSSRVSNMLLRKKPGSSYQMKISTSDLRTIETLYQEDLSKINSYITQKEEHLLLFENVKVISS